jgi:hypothetical protein
MPDEPDIRDALDLNRFHELVRLADMGENLWASLYLAAERGDGAACRYHWGQIRAVGRAVGAVVNALGSEDGANG